MHLHSGFILFWKADLAPVLLWSPVEGTLHRTIPNTHWRRKQLMPDCYAPLCHYSITEGHSFTITVGLWAPADWRSSRWDSRQEFLPCTSAFQTISHFSYYYTHLKQLFLHAFVSETSWKPWNVEPESQHVSFTVWDPVETTLLWSGLYYVCISCAHKKWQVKRYLYVHPKYKSF